MLFEALIFPFFFLFSIFVKKNRNKKKSVSIHLPTDFFQYNLSKSYALKLSRSSALKFWI